MLEQEKRKLARTEQPEQDDKLRAAAGSTEGWGSSCWEAPRDAHAAGGGVTASPRLLPPCLSHPRAARFTLGSRVPPSTRKKGQILSNAPESLQPSQRKWLPPPPPRCTFGQSLLVLVLISQQ